MQYAELEKALVVVAREGSRNIALAREIADWLERRLALAERRTRPE